MATPLFDFRSLFLSGFRQHSRLSVALLVVIVALVTVRYIRSPWRKVPPGPRGFSLIRDVLRLTGKRWLVFAKWREIYGDVVYCSILGQPFLILNSHKAVADLLDRRAGIYSDRPHNIVAGEILTCGLFLPLCHYNEIWRRMRKAAHDGFQKSSVPKYHHIQTTEALLLVQGLLADPNQWDKHFRRTSASIVMSVVYGSPPIKSEQDKSVTFITDMASRLGPASAPGAYLVEFMPFLKMIPSRFAKWKRQVEEWHAHDSAMFESLFKDVHDRVARGEDQSSFSATLITDDGRYGLSLRENAWLAATMYVAGAETTSGVMAWWMLAMTAYPDVQKRAQAELDNVVGRHRVPSFADFEHLPYIRAMVKEALRWRTIGPASLPHCLTQDDWYEGRFIPKGTIVIANVWQLNRDPEIHEDAARFNPARYLDAGECVGGDEKEESHIMYGFGRRVCVGQYLANNSLLMAFAMMLWAVNFERHLDADGKPTPLEMDDCIDEGTLIRPIAFKCNITPRFPEVVTILEHEKEVLGCTTSINLHG